MFIHETWAIFLGEIVTVSAWEAYEVRWDLPRVGYFTAWKKGIAVFPFKSMVN